MLVGCARLISKKNANWRKGERKGGDVALNLQPKFSRVGMVSEVPAGGRCPREEQPLAREQRPGKTPSHGDGATTLDKPQLQNLPVVSTSEHSDRPTHLKPGTSP